MVVTEMPLRVDQLRAVLQQQKEKSLPSVWFWPVLRDFVCNCLSYTVMSQISRNF